MVFLPGAGKKSGSLITVDFANRMHVPVHTVPGSFHDESNAGSNEYLEQGLISCTMNFGACLDQYFIKKESENNEAHVELTKEQALVMNALSQEETIEKLVVVSDC